MHSMHSQPCSFVPFYECLNQCVHCVISVIGAVCMHGRRCCCFSCMRSRRLVRPRPRPSHLVSILILRAATMWRPTAVRFRLRRCRCRCRQCTRRRSRRSRRCRPLFNATASDVARTAASTHMLSVQLRRGHFYVVNASSPQSNSREEMLNGITLNRKKKVLVQIVF